MVGASFICKTDAFGVWRDRVLKSSGVGSSACEEKGGAGGAQQRACNRAEHSHYPQERLYSR